jgi:hypothetical protein
MYKIHVTILQHTNNIKLNTAGGFVYIIVNGNNSINDRSQ